MYKGLQIIGNSKNPYHLSIGQVVCDQNLVALIRKKDAIHTLPRETIYSKESLENALNRGASEELGIETKVIKYLGCLVTHFNRPDGTNIEKTTLYFLSEKTGTTEKQPENDELSDTVEWKELQICIDLLKEQDNDEYIILERLISSTNFR